MNNLKSQMPEMKRKRAEAKSAFLAIKSQTNTLKKAIADCKAAIKADNDFVA